MLATTTMKWVLRQIVSPDGLRTEATVHVLRQLWTPEQVDVDAGLAEEWRDIPVVQTPEIVVHQPDPVLPP